MRRSLGDRLGQRAAVMPSAVLVVLVAMSDSASAFSIDTGNEDWAVRWDNTVRYNLGARAQEPNSVALAHPFYAGGDGKFGRGDVVTNRFDLFSEFDAVYQKRFGLRLSAAGWYDQAYHDTSVNNPAVFPTGEYSSDTKRWYRGPSGELLDAFVFGRFDVGGRSLDLRAGRHNLYWGESLFGFTNSIAYSQGPVDIRKAVSIPGAEAKELFKPVNQISGQINLTDEVALAGQYQLEWKPSSLPDGGTYLGSKDFLTNRGGNLIPLAPGFSPAWVGSAKPDPKNAWGLRMSWTPDAMEGGNVAVYHRRFTDTLPYGSLNAASSAVSLAYTEDIKLTGVSLSTVVAGFSVGSELSYRQNMSLNTIVLPEQGSQPRGNTWHALVNVVKALPASPLYGSATFLAELNYTRLGKVTANPGAYTSVDYGCPAAGLVMEDSCSTRDAWNLAVKFEPVWYQALPGVDLSMPLFYSVGLKGNSPTGDSFKGGGSYSLGLSAVVREKYTVGLSYNGYSVKVKDKSTFATTNQSGASGYLGDRGWVSLTLKATF